MTNLPSACVIGAGSSGIAAAKTLNERGIPFDCFEKSDRVGGNWVFGNTNGMSSAYRSLHINTSRERMEYSDFPMPKSYPDFPHHTPDRRATSTTTSTTSASGTGSRSTPASSTPSAARTARGRSRSTPERAASTTRCSSPTGTTGTRAGRSRRSPARSTATQMHAHYYVDNTDFADKNVLVVGMGNSAMDIAVESSFVARKTILSSRRGAYILPKYLFGRPLDQIGVNRLTGAVPFAFRRRVPPGAATRSASAT